MKKLRIFLLFAASLLTGLSYAQITASELVKKTVDKINAHNNVELVFEYTITNGAALINEKHEGKATLQGKAYRIEMEDQHMISDGTTLWNYLVEDDEVMIGDASGDETLITPIKILTTYDKDYGMKYVKCGEKGIKAVEMTNPKCEFEQVLVKIDEAKHEIVSAELDDGNGNIITFDIKKTIFDQTLKANFFTFDTKAHPKTEVIDMR